MQSWRSSTLTAQAQTRENPKYGGEKKKQSQELVKKLRLARRKKIT